MDGKSVSFWFCNFAVAVGKALHRTTWLEHCVQKEIGVRYRSSEKSKWKFQKNCALPDTREGSPAGSTPDRKEIAWERNGK
jgi:hypothetical protein